MKNKKNMVKINHDDVKVVESSYLRNNWANLTAQIEGTKIPLIVSKRNEQKFVILDIDEYEDYLDSMNPMLKKQIKKSREDYKKGKFSTLEEVMKKYNIK